jgi:hypothetical protein|tara:strand:- start:725 stop:1000 length:276 start_codon:yes stop_codon:yes gene_type:complete
MKRTLIMAALFATISGFAQEKVQCTATTKANIQCKTTAWNNSELCWRHNPDYVKKSNNPTVICSGKTKANTACKQKTSHPSGACFHHRPKN